jgi:hypothetical protein
MSGCYELTMLQRNLNLQSENESNGNILHLYPAVDAIHLIYSKDSIPYPL